MAVTVTALWPAAGMASATRPDRPVRDDIVVLDDYLPGPAYDVLAQLISAQPLIYGSMSNFKTDPHGHWSRDFVAADPNNLADVGHRLETDDTVAALNTAWKFLRSAHSPESILVRCYLDGYT
jgi:hypothetical protein